MFVDLMEAIVVPKHMVKLLVCRRLVFMATNDCYSQVNFYVVEKFLVLILLEFVVDLFNVATMKLVLCGQACHGAVAYIPITMNRLFLVKDNEDFLRVHYP